MATHINATVLRAFDALELFGPERPEITAGIAAAEDAGIAPIKINVALRSWLWMARRGWDEWPRS